MGLDGRDSERSVPSEVGVAAQYAHPPSPLPGCTLRAFRESDIAELVVLQRCCWVQEAVLNSTLDIPALHETADDVLMWARTWTVLVVHQGTRLVAAVRGRADGVNWEIGRLMVAPDLAGRGLGSWLLACIEELAPPDASHYILFTGARSSRNIATYERSGYHLTDIPTPRPSGHITGAVYLVKERQRA